MTERPPVSDDVLAELGKLSTATVFFHLHMRGIARKYGSGPIGMKGVAPLAPGRKLVGRAVTLRYLPTREDLQAEIATSAQADGMNATPRWKVIETCGPGDVLVSDAMGQSGISTGGEIVYGRLHQRGAAGIVTDGAIRDAQPVLNLGWPVYAGGRAASIGETSLLPYEFNVPIQCGGVLVRPGDVVLGDDEGVVVVASALAAEIARLGREHEAVESSILRNMLEENASPSRFYPFNSETLAMHEARNRINGAIEG
jgi:regulator of RNase E activity RraA